MRKLTLTEQQAKLLRELLLTRIVDDSRILGRLENTLPEALIKDARRGVETAVDILALLNSGASTISVRCDGNHAGPPCEDPECWTRPEGDGETPPIPPELTRMGVTIAEHRRALNPSCLHGVPFNKDCKDCARAGERIQTGTEAPGVEVTPGA